VDNLPEVINHKPLESPFLARKEQDGCVLTVEGVCITFINSSTAVEMPNTQANSEDRAILPLTTSLIPRNESGAYVTFFAGSCQWHTAD
jgi:hypothetical protein